MSILDRISGRVLAIAVAVILLAATFFVFTGGNETRTLTAHFSRAVAIYKGSDLRLMGVRIGSVDAVVPEGDSVRVEMSYDADYKLPADAKAAIITPTLVADRYVQVAPAWTKGAVMETGADIPLKDTAAPVEIDRIYKGLADLSTALGPDGANKSGALDAVLSAGAKALRGKGQLANDTILNMSEAAQTFGANSGELFQTVKQLAQLSDALAKNDKFVNQFMDDLGGVSSQLAGERDELSTALASLAKALGTVKGFVHDNKAMVEANVKELTEVLGSVVKEKDALATSLQLGPLGLGNLALGNDVKTGSEGARVQFGAIAQGLGPVLCDMVSTAASDLNAGESALACNLLKVLASPLAADGTNISAGVQLPLPGSSDGAPAEGLGGLLGGGH